MLTSVTKFGKVSVFSDLNNLQDISMDKRYVDICRTREAELSENFGEDIINLAETNVQSLEESSIALKEQYDGYHLNPLTHSGLYYPFSLLNTFVKRCYGNYWFETGTPIYLVEMLKQHKYNLYKMANEKVMSKSLDSINVSSSNPISVIYQSGYLMKGYIPKPQIYELGFPNKEVEQGFMDFLLPYYTPVQDTESEFAIWSFVKDVKTGKIYGFMKRLQVFLLGVRMKWQRISSYIIRMSCLSCSVLQVCTPGGISYIIRSYRPRPADERLCLHNGVQA